MVFQFISAVFRYWSFAAFADSYVLLDGKQLSACFV